MGVPSAATSPDDKKKEKKEKKKANNTLTDDKALSLEDNWKLIHEKEREISERLKELENQKFALEQAR